MSTVKILAFAGSLRMDSFNKKLVKIAAEGARATGAEVTLIDLRDFPMPLYDGDIEAVGGLPENAKKVKQLMIDHHGMLISSPEYNSSISAVLKNTIDWASRAETDDEPSLIAFRGKTVGLMSASPGAIGGLRGLVTVRSIFGNIGSYVLPDQIAISKAHEAFEGNGALKDSAKQKSVTEIGRKFAEFTGKLLAVSDHPGSTQNELCWCEQTSPEGPPPRLTEGTRVNACLC